MDLNIRVAFSAIDKLTRPVNAASKAVGGLSDSLKKTQTAARDLDKQAVVFDKLRTRTNDTAQKLSQAQRAFDGLNQKQREGGQLTEAQSAHLERLRERISRLNQSYSQQTAQLRQAGQAVRQHGVNLTSGSGTVQSAIRRTEQYTRSLERERQQLAAITSAQMRYSKAKETGEKLRGAGIGMTIGATAAGYGAGAFLSKPIGFDTDMSRVAALTRMDKTDPRFTELREQAKFLGASTAFSNSDAAQGEAFLAMAGFTPESIKAALPGVLNTALAGGALSGDISLGETADIGASILNQFQLKASDMGRVGDVLAGTFTRTSTNLRDLGETMKYTGPVAASLGISLEEASAMAGMLANGGLRGSDAGTAMRASLSRLAAPTGAASKALKELGVSVSDSTGKMRPIESILTDLYKATKKYGSTAQVSFFKDIAGEEAFVGLQTLVRSAGTGDLQKLVAELKKAQGESASVAKKMSDNLGGDLSNLGSAWEGLQTEISDTINGPLRDLVQWLDDTITSVAGLVKANPVLAQTLLLVGGSALALVAALGATSLIAGLLIGPLAKLRLGFTLLTGGRGIGGTIAAIRTLGTVSGPAMTGLGGWRTVFAGGIKGMTEMLPTLRKGLMGIFASPGAEIIKLRRGLSGLTLRFGGVTAMLPALRGGLLTVFTAPGRAMAALGRGIGGLALRFGGIAAILPALRGGLLTVFTAPGTSMAALGRGIGGLTLRFGGLATMLSGLRGGLFAVATSPGAAIKSLSMGFGGLLLRLASLFARISGMSAVWGIITGAVSALGAALSFLLSPIGLVVAAFVAAGLLIWQFWEPIKAFFEGFFSGVWEALTPLRDAFAALAPVFIRIGDGIKSVWDWFKKLFEPMQTSKDTLDKFTNAGVTFGQIFGAVLQALVTPLTWVMDAISWMLEKLDVIPSQAQRAQQALKDSADALANHQLPLQQATVVKVNGDEGKPKPPVTDGTLRRLKGIEDNTKSIADNTKKIGPGDIIFKNLPAALALRGAYQEARVIPQPVPRVTSPAAGGILTVPTATQGVAPTPVTPQSSGAPVFQLNFYDVGQKTSQELERMVRQAVRNAMAGSKNKRGSYQDAD